MGILFPTPSLMSNSTPPVTVLPQTFAGWVMPTSTAASSTDVFKYHGTSLDNQIYRKTANWSIWGGSLETFGGTVTIGQWHFWLYRLISTTSRRCHILQPNGVVTTLINTDTSSFAPISYLLGGTGQPQFIAEFWHADVDVYSGSTVTNDTDSLTVFLAMNGPFAFPYALANLIEYKSLRILAQGETPAFPEGYYGRFGKQNWVVSSYGGVLQETADRFSANPVLG
jgi:hypothetical protein